MSILNHRSSQGFTLIEILVALAIAAIALTGSTSSISATLHLSSLHQQKLVAHRIVERKHSELRIAADCPKAYKNVEVKNHDHTWFVSQKVDVAAYPRIRLVTISVKHNSKDKKSLSSVAAFHHCPSS